MMTFNLNLLDKVQIVLAVSILIGFIVFCQVRAQNPDNIRSYKKEMCHE